mmetsp:Transcript_73894/g.196894  ORF Transcript_73894/g.196894 Transcript_73894/m.196894 type:complete len:323 (-) Transcript_73894:87-1055(-)
MAARDSSAVGHASASYFASKRELVQWLNSTFKLQVQNMQQIFNGAVYCQVVDSLFPRKVQMSRVDWGASTEMECLKNYKLLQASLTACGVSKLVPTKDLIGKKLQANLEFLQWAKCFWEQGEKGPYDPLARRACTSKPLPEWAAADVDKEALKKQCIERKLRGAAQMFLVEVYSKAYARDKRRQMQSMDWFFDGCPEMDTPRSQKEDGFKLQFDADQDEGGHDFEVTPPPALLRSRSLRVTNLVNLAECDAVARASAKRDKMAMLVAAMQAKLAKVEAMCKSAQDAAAGDAIVFAADVLNILLAPLDKVETVAADELLRLCG